MGKIVIVEERCKSCGYCVKFCPRNVLAISSHVNAKGYEIAAPVNPEACISCCICAQMCPDGAIEVYK
ncbi:MAG: 4Fe-4S binding protein [Oscillospiraceae bacterium]|nr:4Fe-4S binding protein [Oscillospiraceae bacterium]